MAFIYPTVHFNGNMKIWTQLSKACSWQIEYEIGDERQKLRRGGTTLQVIDYNLYAVDKLVH
jgi:hypothetical protein